MRYSNVRRQFSAAIFLSLFFMAMSVCSLSQDNHKRVGAESAPLKVSAPTDWEVFTSNPDDPSEVLFLQTPDQAPYGVTVSFSLHPGDGNWDELVTRQNYHLLVREGAPISVNEALKLRGARGHKWVYQGRGPNGESRVYYRLYLLLPGSFGKDRLLLMQGAAPAEHSPEIVPSWNAMARSLSWGLDSSD